MGEVQNRKEAQKKLKRGRDRNGAGERSQRLMKAMDALNSRYGRNTVSVFIPSSPKPWAMRREAMPPCYTTR